MKIKKKPIVLSVTLNPAVDKTVIIPDLKLGRVLRPDEISISAGGKGINVSKVLSSLKVETIVSGILPEKGADFIELELLHKRIKFDFMKIEGDVRTNLTIINPRTKRATRIFEPGGVVRRADLSKFKERYERLLKKADVVVISGSNAIGIPDSYNAQLIDIANRSGKVTILDTSLNPLILGAKKKPFMIKPNLQEAEELFGIRIRSRRAIVKALHKLHRYGAEIVIITNGKKDAYVYNGKECIQITPPDVGQKNPVGCGDAFVAGFIAGYLRKYDFYDILRFAAACGTSSAMSINPGGILCSSLTKLKKQTKIKIF